MQFYPYNPDWLPLLQLLAEIPDGKTPEVTELPPGIERHPEAKRIVVYREAYLAGKKAILVQKCAARNVRKNVLGYWMDDVTISDKKHMLVAGVSCRVVKIHETAEPVVVLKEPVVATRNGRQYKQNLPIPVPMEQVSKLPADVLRQPTARVVGAYLGWKL